MKLKGRNQKEIQKDLMRFHGEDSDYNEGKILGSMCTKPQRIAKSAHKMFLHSNLGDPGLFRGTRKLEQEAVRKLAFLMHSPQSVGFLVSGGTEANLMALWAARNKSKATNPEVIVPESAHFSFQKICNLLKLKQIITNLDHTYRADPQSIENCITDQTAAIVATAGTAELGAVDPIQDISKIASEHNLPLHVDAAFGGLVIPFLKTKKQNLLQFDFQLEGVTSITVDPHKMGMSTIPAGSILFKDRNSLEYIRTETPYLTERAQYTFLGTRSGASAAATWAVLESLGIEGFGKTVNQCLKLTNFLARRIKSQGLALVINPVLNIVAFRTPNTRQTVQHLRNKGWLISYVPRIDCIRIVVMPHIESNIWKHS